MAFLSSSSPINKSTRKAIADTWLLTQGISQSKEGGGAESRSSTDTLAVLVCPASKKQVFREWAELTLLLKQSRVAGHRLESYADLSNANQLPNPTWTEFPLSKPRQNSTLITNIPKFLVNLECFVSDIHTNMQ